MRVRRLSFALLTTLLVFVPPIVAAGTLVQTDLGGACFPFPTFTRPLAFAISYPRLVDPNGTPGVLVLGAKLLAGQKNVLAVLFESVALGRSGWPGGGWHVPLYIVTGNRYLTWTETYIYRVSANCETVGIVGSLQAQSISIAAAGVYAMDVQGAAQVADPTDKAYIALAFSNSDRSAQKWKEQSFEFIADQTIASPF